MLSKEQYQEILDHDETMKGTILGKELGNGTFGTVYDVFFTQNHQYYHEDFVIKIIDVTENYSLLKEQFNQNTLSNKNFYNYESFREKSENEFKLFLNCKDSKHLLILKDWKQKTVSIDDIDHDLIFILMPRMQHTLDEWNGPYNEIQVIDIGIQMCDALIELSSIEFISIHGKKTVGIVHRDIKPNNIFYNLVKSRNPIYKLGDLGLSRTINASQTASSTISNTKNYFFSSFESHNDEHLDQRADIYSLGAVLYYLANNHQVPDYIKVACNHGLSDEDKPIHASDQLWDIIKKATAFDKNERYPSAVKMKESLKMALKITEANSFQNVLKRERSLISENKELNTQVRALSRLNLYLKNENQKLSNTNEELNLRISQIEKDTILHQEFMELKKEYNHLIHFIENEIKESKKLGDKLSHIKTKLSE